jgi:hypothetical protein
MKLASLLAKDGSKELSRFVELLSKLSLDLLGLILVAGGFSIYRSDLLRHILVNEITSVISEQARLRHNQPGNCARAHRPVLELLDHRYMVSMEDAATAEILGVDHFGIRPISDVCPWYIQRRGVELCYQASTSFMRTTSLIFLSIHFFGPL